MKLSALSSLQVQNYLRLLEVNGEVVMINDLNILAPGQFTVVNIDPTPNGEGTHWTAIVVNKSRLLYFDSFGAPPPVKIVTLARNAGLPILWNNFIIQDFNSDACGYYCVLFLWAMKTKQSVASYNAFINTFYDDTQQNERIMLNIFDL